MAVTPACPPVEVLQRLALGQMPPAEVEGLASHCERCPHCVQILHGLRVEDTLLEAMAAQDTPLDQSGDAAVNSLIERLKHLPSPASSSMELTTLGGVATPSVDEPPSIQQTLSSEIGLAPPQSPDEIGRLGGYRIFKILGAGGMGVVYHAEDVHLQRPIALKVMKPTVGQNPTARERFLREARAAAKLRSDYVVNIYQVGEERQVVFLAMEFLEGMSLETWLKENRRPTPAQALRIARQIALGLADAHGCGLIHRDIKPGNIWLDSRHDGRVKLLDFGLARGDNEEQHLTQSGMIVGTPAFMAPEQARGKHVDPRGDLFSLGVVLYRLTTGKLPFRGNDAMSVLTSLAVDMPTPPRQINADIPPRLAALIEQLLAKDREQRPKTAQAVADELAAIEREPMQETPEEPTVQIRAARVREMSASTAPSRSRFRWLTAAALLLLLGSAAAAIVVIIRDKDGTKIAEINVPKDGSVEIKDDSKDKKEAKPAPEPKEQKLVVPAAKEEKTVPVAPLTSRQAGPPLSPIALVRYPVKLPGVSSWSIETRQVRDAGAIAYRPDGKRLAVASGEGHIRIWEPESGRLVQMVLSTNRIFALAWSPDGRVLAAGFYGKQPVRLWEAETGRFIRALEKDFPDVVSGIAWSSDGQKVLGWSQQQGRCLVWNVADGKRLRTTPLPYKHGSFRLDSKRLAGQRNDGQIVIWDTETGQENRALDTPTSPLVSFAWSPDGKRLAAAEAKGLQVWDIETGKECFAYKQPLAGSLSWSPDGHSLVCDLSGNRGVVKIDLDKESKPQRLEQIGRSFLAWSPDGKSIARAIHYMGKGVFLHDAVTGKQLRALSEGSSLAEVACSGAGQSVAVLPLGEKQTFLSSMDTGQVFATLKDTGGPLAWSPDGKTLATGGPGHAVLLWEKGGKTRLTLTGHEADVAWLAWSPDGKRLASSSAGEKRVLLWDADKAERLRELGPLPATTQSLMWSPEGRLLAFYVPEIGWHFWDVKQNKLANEPKQWKEPRLSFAPNGRSALVANYGETYRVRDQKSGKEGVKLTTPAFRLVSPPVWSPDGLLLAVALDWRIELWRGDGSRRLRILYSTGPVQQIVFSRDGKVVAGLTGERLHTWETDTGRPRGIQLLGEQNNGLTLTLNGHHIGNEKVKRGIVVVVRKDDGTQELLEPDVFERKYDWKNRPSRVHLLRPLVSPWYPLPGMPMGPSALVSEPAELEDATSWTLETVSPRGNINAAVYRPDGKLLAMAGDDGTVRIWDTSSGELVRMLVAAPILSLAWSRNGMLLAASCSDGMTRLWAPDTGRVRQRLPNASGQLFWPPDGRTLVSADSGKVRYHDLASGRILRALNCPGVVAGRCAWSPDGTRIAFVDSGEKTLHVHDTVTGKEIHKLEGHAGEFLCVAWSPDGQRLASGGRVDAGFRVWDADTGMLLKHFPVENARKNTTRTLAWSPDGKAVVLGFDQGPHGLYDADTGRFLHSFDAGHLATTLTISPDGKQTATASSHGVCLHNTSTGKLEHLLGGLNGLEPIRALAWSPDSRRLALGYPKGQILEAATGQRGPSLPEEWRMAVWSSDGKMLAVLIADGSVQLWDEGNQRRIRALEGKRVQWTCGLAFSPNNRKIAAVGGHKLQVWSNATGKEIWTHTDEEPRDIVHLAFSPDSKRLATADGESGDKRAARIWEADSGNLVSETPLARGVGKAGRIAWSPDGKALAVAPTPQNECLLLESGTGAVQARIKPNEPGFVAVTAIHWSADDNRFSVLDRQETRLRLFDPDAGKEVQSISLPGLVEDGSMAQWSPDGRVLARSNSWTIALNDRDGHALGVLLPGDRFARLAITPDGHYRGSPNVERHIRMVVQKRDGTSETLTPHEFEQKYGFKNDPAKVRLIDP